MGLLAEHDAATEGRIHKLLEYLYPSFNVALRNYPNIEDFLNLIEMAREFNTEEYVSSPLWPESELKKVRRSVLRAVTDYFWARMKDCDLEPLRKFVDCCLRPHDTIITFNWDVTMEQALEKHSDLQFWYEPTTDVILLKPHGSIDWFYRSNIPTGEAEMAVRTIDDDLCVYPEFSFAKYKKMKRPEPVIVPPLFQKKFTVPYLKGVWRSIYRAVSRASDIYILGYSLPKEDQFARLVLGRALRNNKIRIQKRQQRALQLTVVNPDEGAQATFMRLLGGTGKAGFRFYHATFERFVTSPAEDLIDL